MIKTYVVPKDDSKKEKAKAWLHNKKVDAECWWEENKSDVIALTPVVAGVIAVSCKFGNNLIKAHREKYMREHSVWDPRAQHWWIFKKKPTTWQWSEIDRRTKNGENMADVFRSLGMLK